MVLGNYFLFSILLISYLFIEQKFQYWKYILNILTLSKMIVPITTELQICNMICDVKRFTRQSCGENVSTLSVQLIVFLAEPRKESRRALRRGKKLRHI